LHFASWASWFAFTFPPQAVGVDESQLLFGEALAKATPFSHVLPTLPDSARYESNHHADNSGKDNHEQFVLDL